jgi:hypothetical protein
MKLPMRHLDSPPGGPAGPKQLFTETIAGPPVALASVLAKNRWAITGALQKRLGNYPVPADADSDTPYLYTVDSVIEDSRGNSIIRVTVWYQPAGG